MLDLNQFKFNPQDSQMIVNGIVEGYREYIEHRKMTVTKLWQLVLPLLGQKETS